MDAAEDLRAAVLRMEHPGLAKAREPSRREQCESHATVAFGLGLEADGVSQRGFAKRVGVCERIVRDWLSGARNFPVFAVFFLNRRGQIAFTKYMLTQVPAGDAEHAEAAE